MAALVTDVMRCHSSVTAVMRDMTSSSNGCDKDIMSFSIYTNCFFKIMDKNFTWLIDELQEFIQQPFGVIYDQLCCFKNLSNGCDLSEKFDRMTYLLTAAIFLGVSRMFMTL